MANQTAAVSEDNRISTGIKQLDEILNGGIPRGSINIVMGHPGTGKTVFAEQLAFHNASSDRPILYITTLSEPMSKVLTYLQNFAFYSEDKMMDAVHYWDIGNELIQDGPGVLVQRVREAIRELGPKIIVIDSFKAVHELSDSPSAMRRLVVELAGLLSAYDATAFLIGEYSEGHIPILPEFAVADGIIEFLRKDTAKRDERFLRIFKLRGSSYAEGLHAFRISSDGLTVYPRLVTPRAPLGYRTNREQVSTGIKGLDKILNGGWWRGSTALVTGQAGTGKTTFALQFALDGVRAGERSLYLNFQENPTQLARTIGALGVDLEEYAERGLLLRYASPVELRIDSIVVELFEMIQAERVTRVVVDALGDLALAAGDRSRFHDYLYSLCQHLIVCGVTAVFTMEVIPDMYGVGPIEDARFSSLADAMVELKLDMHGRPKRTLRVVKARGVAHDLRVHEMVIEAGGIRVVGPLDE